MVDYNVAFFLFLVLSLLLPDSMTSSCHRIRRRTAAATMPSMTATSSRTPTTTTNTTQWGRRRSLVVALLLVLLQSLVLPEQVSGQSNYASHANNIAYQGEGLPEEATLDGKVSKLARGGVPDDLHHTPRELR